MKKFYRKNFLFLEFIISFVAVFVLYYISKKFGYLESIATNIAPVRGGLYGTLAALSGAMLGFIITGLSVLLTTGNNPQTEKFKTSKHYKSIFKIFFNTSKYLALFLLVALISLIVDSGTQTSITVLFINVWFLIIVGFRIGRCIWVLEKIVGLHILK